MSDEVARVVQHEIAHIRRLNAEIERLRAALAAIVARSKGGTGAAVCVTPTTLAKIAEQALGLVREVSDE